MDKKSDLHPILLTPGPVPISTAVLNTLSEPMIHHRTEEFVSQLKEVQSQLKQFFQTTQEVIILNATGTGAMSAALLNTLSPKDTVLALCAGKFGERWAEMAEAYNLKVLRLTVPWGEEFVVQKVREELERNPQIKAVLVQACETSTGVLHPIQEIAELVRNKTNTLLIVDAISALGAVSIPMDKWCIDILIGGSQKSFALPAGMSFIALSKKAWRFNKESRLSVYYLDLKKEKDSQMLGQTRFSSNVSFVKAIHTSLLPLKKGELNYFIQKSQKLSNITLEFCKNLGLSIFAKRPSPSVTSIMLPDHIDGVKLKKQLETDDKIIFGGGQERLKGKIIRVGHLGNISISELVKGLKALALALHKQDPRLIGKKKVKKSLSELEKYHQS